MAVMDLGDNHDVQQSQDACIAPPACLKPLAVRKRFLELSVLVHPDKNPSPSAKEVGAVLKTSSDGDKQCLETVLNMPF